MSYDYSTKFLKANADVMRKMIQIASTGEIVMYETEDWDLLKSRQRLVNNVLANMARNVPDYKDIRERVRAWTAFKDENTYQLFIGVPQRKMPGRPPGKGGMADRSWESAFMPVVELGRKGDYDYEPVIHDATQLMPFIGNVHALPIAMTRATAKLADMNDAAIEYFTEEFGPKGWKVSAEGNLIILER